LVPSISPLPKISKQTFQATNKYEDAEAHPKHESEQYHHVLNDRQTPGTFQIQYVIFHIVIHHHPLATKPAVDGVKYFIEHFIHASSLSVHLPDPQGTPSLSLG
jgi:hypothetical protein